MAFLGMLYPLVKHRGFYGRVGCEEEFKGCSRSCSYLDRGFFHKNCDYVSFKGVFGEPESNGEIYSLLTNNS